MDLFGPLWTFFGPLFTYLDLFEPILTNLDLIGPTWTYQVTQNKVHHLLAILYLIFEVNITQVYYTIQCIIANEVQLKF